MLLRVLYARRVGTVRTRDFDIIAVRCLRQSKNALSNVKRQSAGNRCAFASSSALVRGYKKALRASFHCAWNRMLDNAWRTA